LSDRGQGLAVGGLRHLYPGQPRPVVDIGAWAVAAGRKVAVSGPSGSGKTTLLYLLTGIEPVRAGHVRWGGQDLAGLPEWRRDAWRRRHTGFVFQDFHLLPGLAPLANVLATCWFDAFRPTPAQRARAHALLDETGAPAARRDVTSLSRGEQQRVAIARALLHEPELLVCDEPTASLDAATGRGVIDLLTSAAARRGATLLVVTHDPALVEAMDEAHRLEHGRLEQVR